LTSLAFPSSHQVTIAVPHVHAPVAKGAPWSRAARESRRFGRGVGRGR
jgi:hypothetical protein